MDYVDGADLQRWAEGRADRFAEIATELVRLKVDVIVSTGAAAREVIHATSVIPVVFALWGDPIGSGYITGSDCGGSYSGSFTSTKR